MHTDNPAGRLLHLLTEGRNLNTNLVCKNAWAELLDIEDAENLALLMSRLGKVMELPEQIINLIKLHYPNQQNSHSHWSQKVNTAFAAQNLHGNWGQFIQQIDNHTINYLSMSVDLLDSKEMTKVLSDDELSDIYDSIHELKSTIIDTDLDDNFKKYIIRYLTKIMIAIEEYKITGALPIVESIESLFGHAFVDDNYRKNIKETEYGKHLVNILGSVASVVTIAVGLPELPNTFKLLLESTK